MTQYPPPADSTGGYQQPQASTPSYGQTSSYGATPSYGNPANQTYSTYGTGPKPKSDKKTFGLWALILGISAIVIPIGLNGVAGIALGIVGLIKENSKGMSITGIVLGGVGAFIWAPIFWAAVVPGIVFLLFGGASLFYYY